MNSIIEELCRLHGLSVGTFAKLIGVSKGAVKQYELNKVLLSSETIAKIEYGVKVLREDLPRRPDGRHRESCKSDRLKWEDSFKTKVKEEVQKDNFYAALLMDILMGEPLLQDFSEIEYPEPKCSIEYTFF